LEQQSADSPRPHPGMDLWEVMGCRESEISTGDKGRTELRWTSSGFPGMKPGDTVPARWYEETLMPMNDRARVLAEFAGGRPAAIESTFGKGKTLTLGSYVSAAAYSSPSETAERFFAGLLQWAGVTLPVETAAAGIEVRYLDSGSDRLVFVFNHSKQAAQSHVSIRMAAGNYSAVDLVTDSPVALERNAASIRFQTSLKPDGVRVLKVSSK